MHIELEHYSLRAGPALRISLSGSPDLEPDHLQINVISVGVLNPSFVTGMAAQRVAPGQYVAMAPTDHLKPGLYEVQGVQPGMSAQAPSTAGRCIFEICDAPRAVSANDLRNELAEAERRIEHDFLDPVHATLGMAQPTGALHTAFAFVRGVLLGTKMRFRHFEILPLKDGLDPRDNLERVNSFLRDHTSTGVAFPYAGELARQSRIANPVCVFHFPAVIARNPLEVKDYAESRTELALLALSLTRDASGQIFDTVTFNHQTRQAITYTHTESYRGNLVTGSISGENPDVIENFTQRLHQSQFDRFLVSLYKQAQREPTPDFQYVRYWQILEIMAEAQNYDPSSPLLDYDGVQITEDGKPQQTRGSANIVFALFRDSGIGSTQSTWKNVNVWFAFRTAAAHHGALRQFTQLARPSVRAWAAMAWDEIQSSGHDSYLWTLKEDVKLLLMRKLNKVAPWDQS